MSDGLITVNELPFFGRVEEQKQLRAVLQDLVEHRNSETLPYIVLLYGDGGIGKSTLAQRFVDIAGQEFGDRFQRVWIDWEDERQLAPALQVGRDQIRPEDVFDRLFVIFDDYLATTRIEKFPGMYFRKYVETLDKRKQLDQKIARVLETPKSPNQPDEWADLRGASASFIAGLVRQFVPAMGSPGEKVVEKATDLTIKITIEQIRRLHTTLQAKLTPEEYALLLSAQQELARALADGLRQLGQWKRLILVFDTYEIVDRTDLWAREMIKAAGPNVLWVIAGRTNLARSRQFGDGYFKGYVDEFPRRLLAYDVHELARDDIRAYFDVRVHERPLDEEALEAISRATRGIPLAVREAAAIWRAGRPLVDIVADVEEDTPSDELVRRMTERYLLHVPKTGDDRRALYALALCRGNRDLLRAMLRPSDGTQFDLDALLRRLEREYASVHRAAAKLHDEAAAFFLAELQSERLRGEEWVEQLNARAVAELRHYLDQRSADLPLIEERCTDPNWVKAALDLADYLFWQNEDDAWKWLIPRLVEGLGYNDDLQLGLWQIAHGWQAYLSPAGREWLKLIDSSGYQFRVPDAESEMLGELDRPAGRRFLSGDGEGERRAILSVRRALLSIGRKQFRQAKQLLEDAERHLPLQGEALKQQVGAAWQRLGAAFSAENNYDEALSAYQRSQALLGEGFDSDSDLGDVFYSLNRYADALDAYERMVDRHSDYAGGPNGMGLVYAAQARYQEALAAYQQALDLCTTDAERALVTINLGNVYQAQARYQEALTAYEQASTLDPHLMRGPNGLGLVYAAQARYDDARTAYQRAFDLCTTDAERAVMAVTMGDLHRMEGHYDDALLAYKQAVELVPDSIGAHYWLGAAYRLQHLYSEALPYSQRAVELGPDNGPNRISLAAVYRELGREGDFAEQAETARQHMTNADEYDKACFAAICGDTDEALKLLRTALENGSQVRAWARNDPDFESLHDDPRFITLVEEKP